MTTLYSIVKDQFPEFVRSDYPAFVEFVQAYYKWLEIQSAGKIEDIVDIDTPSYVVAIQNYQSAIVLSDYAQAIIVGQTSGARAIVKSTVSGSPHNLYVQYITTDVGFAAGEILTIEGTSIQSRVVSVNTVASTFVTYFKQQLDVYGLFDNADPYNIRYLKNIKEIYASKGSEQALVFMLQTVHGIMDTTIRYPSENILRASDGKWSQLQHLTVRRFQGPAPATPPTQVFVQVGNTSTRVVVERCEFLNATDVRIYFNQPLIVEVGQVVYIPDGNTIECAARIIENVTNVEIVAGGEKWQLGQLLVFPGSVKDTIARVSDTDAATGRIKHIQILEYGWSHTVDQTITARPSNISGVETEATLTLKTGVIAKMPGRWADASGQISNQEIRLEDNKYYQQFSYDIESTTNPAVYTNLAQTIHPAGMALFSTYILERTIAITPVIVTTYPYKTVGLFDIVLAQDSDIEFVFIKNDLESIAYAVDQISLRPAKYLPEDTVSVVSEDTATSVVTGVTYDSEEYFEVPVLVTDRYGALETVLTLSQA